MARTVLQRRRDGTYVIRRVGTWRWVWLALGAACVVLPLALSLVVLVPPIVLALPPLTLGLGTWILVRNLDSAEPRPVAPRGGPARVIPLRGTPREIAARARETPRARPPVPPRRR